MAAVVDRLAPPLRAIRDVLRNPDLRRLELAFVGFNMAEWATWIAILVYAYEVGGPTAVGVVALIQLIPAAIVAPFASLLGDRYRRDRVLVFGYLAQAVSMGATALALLTEAPVPVAYALAAIAASSITLTRPVQNALLPALARTPEELTASNATSATVEGVSILAGPAIAGFLLGIGSPGAVFAVMAAWLLISALFAMRIQGDVLLEERSGAAPGRLLRESLRGFRALAARPGPRLLVGLGGAQTLVWGALDVLIVLLALELLHTGASGVGYLNSALGVGGLIGGMVTLTLIGRRRLTPAIGAGMLLWGVPIALVGIVPGRVAAPLLLGLVGAGHSLMDVAGRTLLQRIIPDEVLSRVFGVLEGLIMAGLGIGSILAPLLVAGFGVRGALVTAGALLPLLGALTWGRLRRVDAAAAFPEREIALLRPLPIFAPLSMPVIERLASNMAAVSVPAGAMVIRQGDAGDRFYVVAEGELDVAVDDEAVGTLRSGDHFGEIALLHDVPRTATVTARTDACLFSLERDEFIAAVTGHAKSAEAAETMIEERLSRSEGS